MLKAQVVAVSNDEPRMLLKTISRASGTCGWEPRWEPRG